MVMSYHSNDEFLTVLSDENNSPQIDLEEMTKTWKTRTEDSYEV